MAKDPIKKAENGTYYFRANLGFHPITGKQIQKYKSGFKTKKEAREAYSKPVSYTHLDVYKRQYKDRTPDSPSGFPRQTR